MILALCALAVSGAVGMILELEQGFGGPSERALTTSGHLEITHPEPFIEAEEADRSLAVLSLIASRFQFTSRSAI